MPNPEKTTARSQDAVVVPRARKRHRPVEKGECVECGKIVTGYRRTKFCSRKCDVAFTKYMRRLWPKPTDSERFWRYVDKNGPVPADRPELGACWLWTGRRFKKKPYGKFRLLGGKEVRAHRYADVLEYGAVPDGLPLDHECSNEPCIRPSHLTPVTPLENVRRTIARGRAAFQRLTRVRNSAK